MPRVRTLTAKRLLRIVLIPVTVYACWLALMVVHEAGHVLHAWFSGGDVERVDVPLLGFSQTFYAENPNPHFVAWGGAAWGCAIPLLVLAAFAKGPRRVRRLAQFFAGFCLVANGAYLGIGWTLPAGDAADLRHHGTPVAVMIAFGVVATASGLLLWHLLDSEVSRPGQNPAAPTAIRASRSSLSD